MAFPPHFKSLAGLFCVLIFAEPTEAARHCVFIVLPPCGWETAPGGLLELADAAGSLSCAVPRPMTEAAAWVTLGAGNRALWSEDLWPQPSFDPANASARVDFARRLQILNSRLPYPIETASLGETLHKAGRRTALVGLRKPWHLTAVMDARGEVDYMTAEVSARALQQALVEADYLVVNGAAATDAEFLTRGVSALLGQEDLLIVAALTPADSPFVGLAPIIVRGGGFTKGALVSPTTRRPGLVANIDLAPTVLRYFGVALPESYTNGAVMETAGGSAFDRQAAVWLDAKGRQVDEFRHVGLPGLILLQMVFVVLAVVKRWPSKPRLRGGVMLGLLALPAATYLTVLAPPKWGAGALTLLMLSPSVLIGVTFAVRSRLTKQNVSRAILGIAVVTVILVVVGQSHGARWPPLLPLGYALGFGGRFYGISNETAGLLIAAALLGVGMVMEQELAWTIRLALVVVGVTVPLLTIAHPALGANAGCTLVAFMAPILLFLLMGKQARAYGLGFFIALVVLTLVFILAGSGQETPDATHIGRAWMRLSEEGWPFVTELVRRKTYTAWRIMAQTPILFVLGAWVLVWSYALLRPPRFVEHVYGHLPALRAPLRAIAMAGVAAAVLNDTTVLIPTTMLQFALPALGLASCLGGEQHPNAATGLPGD
ncbi:MAG: hypothetical protein ACUVX8_00855 [Candidatus Zipacnadales bacterium]